MVELLLSPPPQVISGLREARPETAQVRRLQVEPISPISMIVLLCFVHSEVIVLWCALHSDATFYPDFALWYHSTFYCHCTLYYSIVLSLESITWWLMILSLLGKIFHLQMIYWQCCIFVVQSLNVQVKITKPYQEFTAPSIVMFNLFVHVAWWGYILVIIFIL